MLARRVEADLRPALHRHLQVELVRREIHRVAVDVGRERRRAVALEVAAHLLVGKGEPARGRDARVVVDRVDLVLASRGACATTSNCSWPDGAQQQRVADDGLEHLDRAFLAQLLQALLQLLGLERIARARDAEELRREIRDALERERLAFGQRVADLELAVVVDADDVAGDRVLALRRARWP